MTREKLQISIITPSYNQGKFIQDNIESVLSQNFDSMEHIIIDGGSTDNTLSILKKYNHLKWISEKDDGPVDALIKGIKMSKGKIITWLNSDDYLAEDVLNTINDEFRNNKIEVLVGNMICIKPDKQFMYKTDYKENYNINYLIRINSDIITQPSTFFLKDLFDRSGGFDKRLKYIWDYDLFLKIFKISKPKFIEKTLAYQRIYDDTISRNNARNQAKEIYKVARSNGAKLTDPIMKIVLKRFLFPDSVKQNPGHIVKYYRKIKNFFKSDN